MAKCHPLSLPNPGLGGGADAGEDNGQSGLYMCQPPFSALNIYCIYFAFPTTFEIGAIISTYS
jgi:hypothetical protein